MYTPTILQGMQGKCIIQMSAGVDHAIFLSDSGDVYMWGTTSAEMNIVSVDGERTENTGPRLVNFLALEKALTGHRIQIIACGNAT
jgi:alpha-tubulin suppressor-like RCC1 family protein